MSGEQPALRRPPVKCAGPAPELAELEFDQLRAYRAALSAEEDRVSYWRRLLHGRIDVLEAQAVLGSTLTLDELVRVLGDTGSGQSRHTLMGVPAPVQLPDLPDLSEFCAVWEAQPEDAADTARLVEELREREVALSEYRTALHERIDAATGELIVRYRADPRAALALLPRE